MAFFLHFILLNLIFLGSESSSPSLSTNSYHHLRNYNFQNHHNLPNYPSNFPSPPVFEGLPGFSHLPSPGSREFSLSESGVPIVPPVDHHASSADPDWALMGNGNSGRPPLATCVPIPGNMTLCHDIGYDKMRLPNLLEHDSLAEAVQQAGSWMPLLNIKCHPDTKLFLCALFSPVCVESVDRTIYPCRSLCDVVRAGCEGRMKAYGFPWPEMLRCDKFPPDNDMCIRPLTRAPELTEGDACSACNQVQTYENILDNFCRADFAVKTKIKKITKTSIICKRAKIFKSSSRDGKSNRKPKFILEKLNQCCNIAGKRAKSQYLIMGNQEGDSLTPTFIMEWSKDSVAFKKAVKRFKTLDCSDPKMVSESMVADGAIRMASPYSIANAQSSSTAGTDETESEETDFPESHQLFRNSGGRKGGRAADVEENYRDPNLELADASPIQFQRTNHRSPRNKQRSKRKKNNEGTGRNRVTTNSTSGKDRLTMETTPVTMDGEPSGRRAKHRRKEHHRRNVTLS